MGSKSSCRTDIHSPRQTTKEAKNWEEKSIERQVPKGWIRETVGSSNGLSREK